jgi:hypothetical protein
MKRYAKWIPFILLVVGTFGLLAVEVFDAPEGDGSRRLVLTFAALNVLGLVVLAAGVWYARRRSGS